MGWVRSKVEEGGRRMDKYFLPCGQLRRMIRGVINMHTVQRHRMLATYRAILALSSMLCRLCVQSQ